MTTEALEQQRNQKKYEFGQRSYSEQEYDACFNAFIHNKVFEVLGIGFDLFMCMGEVNQVKMISCLEQQNKPKTNPPPCQVISEKENIMKAAEVPLWMKYAESMAVSQPATTNQYGFSTPDAGVLHHTVKQEYPNAPDVVYAINILLQELSKGHPSNLQESITWYIRNNNVSPVSSIPTIPITTTILQALQAICNGFVQKSNTNPSNHWSR